MLISRALLAVSFVSLAACASEAPTGGDESETVTARSIRISGPKAERLLAAFVRADAVDHAMGGRASVDVRALSALTASNGALDDTDELFLVPTTSASFDNAASPGKRAEIQDGPAVANVIFDALAAVDESLSDSAMQRTFVTASKVGCDGQGAGAGAEEEVTPIVTCTVVSESGASFTVRDAAARRIVQAFGLAGAVDHAMGGRFSVAASDVKCERRSNGALDESDPMFNVPAHGCTFAAESAKKIEDAFPVAFALRSALEAAGLVADSAMGHTGVSSAHVTCAKGPGVPTRCVLARD
jgi:hypothetical protein